MGEVGHDENNVVSVSYTRQQSDDIIPTTEREGVRGRGREGGRKGEKETERRGMEGNLKASHCYISHSLPHGLQTLELILNAK